MAQHGTFAKSQYGGHTAALEGKSRMADGIDAAMYAVQAASSDPARSTVLIDARPSKLG